MEDANAYLQKSPYSQLSNTVFLFINNCINNEMKTTHLSELETFKIWT